MRLFHLRNYEASDYIVDFHKLVITMVFTNQPLLQVGLLAEHKLTHSANRFPFSQV